MRKLLLGTLLLAGCAGSSPAPSSVAEKGAKAPVPGGALVYKVSHDEEGRGQVGEYVSSWNGFRTSSYWIEGPTGLILIDTQFLLSAAEEFVNTAERITGKKAVLAVVLHPNPDKFNGTAVLQKRGIRVVTSAQVLAKVAAVHQLRLGWFYKRFQPDYPKDAAAPESFGDKTTEIEAAGLKLKLHVLGAGCSDAHVVAQLKDQVFVGDLVTRGFHAWLELGLLDEWLKRLDDIRELEPALVHTGRGGTVEPGHLDWQEHYLRTVIWEVGKHNPIAGRPPSVAQEKKITGAIKRKFPDLDYPAFIKIGPLWKRLTTHRRNFVQ